MHGTLSGTDDIRTLLPPRGKGLVFVSLFASPHDLAEQIWPGSVKNFDDLSCLVWPLPQATTQSVDGICHSCLDIRYTRTTPSRFRETYLACRHPLFASAFIGWTYSSWIDRLRSRTGVVCVLTGETVESYSYFSSFVLLHVVSLLKARLTAKPFQAIPHSSSLLAAKFNIILPLAPITLLNLLRASDIPPRSNCSITVVLRAVNTPVLGFLCAPRSRDIQYSSLGVEWGCKELFFLVTALQLLGAEFE